MPSRKPTTRASRTLRSRRAGGSAGSGRAPFPVRTICPSSARTCVRSATASRRSWNTGVVQRRGCASAEPPATRCPSAGSSASPASPRGRPGQSAGQREQHAGDTSWYPPAILGVYQGLLTTNPDIAGWAYEYADGMHIGSQTAEDLGIPVKNLTVALRTTSRTCSATGRSAASPRTTSGTRPVATSSHRRRHRSDAVRRAGDPGRGRRTRCER